MLFWCPRTIQRGIFGARVAVICGSRNDPTPTPSAKQEGSGRRLRLECRPDLLPTRSNRRVSGSLDTSHSDRARATKLSSAKKPPEFNPAIRRRPVNLGLRTVLSRGDLFISLTPGLARRLSVADSSWLARSIIVSPRNCSVPHPPVSNNMRLRC